MKNNKARSNKRGVGECEGCGIAVALSELDEDGLCEDCAEENKIRCIECNEIEVQDEGDICRQCFETIRESRRPETFTHFDKGA